MSKWLKQNPAYLLQLINHNKDLINVDRIVQPDVLQFLGARWRQIDARRREINSLAARNRLLPICNITTLACYRDLHIIRADLCQTVLIHESKHNQPDILSDLLLRCWWFVSLHTLARPSRPTCRCRQDMTIPSTQFDLSPPANRATTQHDKSRQLVDNLC